MMEKEQLIRFIEGIVTQEELQGVATVDQMKEMGEKLLGRIDVQQEQLDGLQSLLGNMQVKMTQMQLQVISLEEQLAAKEAELNAIKEEMRKAPKVIVKEVEPVATEEPKPVVQEEPKPVVQEEVKPVVQEELQPLAQEESKPVVQEEVKPVETEEPVKEHAQTIAESIKGEESLAEKLSKKVEHETVASSLNASKIERMQTAITIADRFRFQRELFDGDAVKMAETVEAMNGMKSLDEALAYLDKRFHWDADSAAVMDFVKIVERRF